MSSALSTELWPDVYPEPARRLMLAGVESFAARGYHATTTRDIARGAGMSPAALYVHFPSKAALLFTISRSGHEQALALVQRAAAEHDTPPAALRALTEVFVGWHARRHTVAKVVQHEIDALPEQEYRTVAELRRQIESHVRETISDGVRTGAFHVSEVKLTARAVLSLGVDVARWYSDRTPQSPEELGRQYGELALRIVGSSSAGHERLNPG